MIPLFLTVLCVFMFILIVSMLFYIRRIKTQIKQATLILDDIAAGNLDRRIITHEDTEISLLCHKINEIVINTKAEIVNHLQSEKSYRQLITSLSHDIRTPMASLVGYLNAVEDGIVENAEKDEYIKLSLGKAFDLKDYVDTLFEWLKLESGEHIFNFEKLDICELTREIITDWIPRIEKEHIDYEISIPETEIKIDVDQGAYRRIIDNLFQNILIHSNASKINMKIYVLEQTVKIILSDNGMGISDQHLPFIFNRLYKCDSARRAKGNGLGLSIVSELVKAHNGKISVSSVLEHGTNFMLIFPCKYT